VQTTQQLTPSQSVSSTTSYDAVGRVRLTIDTAGNKVQKAYRFAAGGTAGSYELGSNPYTSNTSNSDPAMGWTLTTRDNMGRIVTAQDYGQDNNGDSPPTPWGSGANVTGKATAVYNQATAGCNGPTTNSTDEALNIRISCTDGLGRLTGVTEPNGNVTNYTYDLLDNLITVSVPGQTRSFTYSTLSRLFSATNPE
jgi:YD repeat-containing protein